MSDVGSGDAASRCLQTIEHQPGDTSADGGPMPDMDRARRATQVRQCLDEQGVDALVVTKGANIRWLTGFTGSSGIVVITPTDITVITDGRYRTQLAQQLDAAGVEATAVIERDIKEPLRASVNEARLVALEADHITWSRQQAIADWLRPASMVATVGLIEQLRQVKDSGEICRLVRAAAIADQALALIVDRYGLTDGDRHRAGATGPSEQAVARDLEAAMLDLGADGRSFAPIVAAGPNSALPHAQPSNRLLEAGDLLIIDFGASVDGYGSDMTRTFRLGSVSDRADEIYAAVVQSQAAGVAAVVDGVAQADVDAACRDSLVAAGLGDTFIHGTGHGIGLEIHEEPFISTRSTGILRTNQVVTVEPGAYLPGFGGVRIEDSVVVTDSGCEPITRHPKPTVTVI